MNLPLSSALNNSSSKVHIPEEVLEYIISLSLQSSVIDKTRPLSTASVGSPSTLLLVSKSFERITKPLLYNALHLRTREQADKLALTLSARPTLSSHIRAIRIDGPSASRAFYVAAQLMSISRPSRTLDLLDIRIVDERTDSDIASCKEDLERLYAALHLCPDVRRLVVRQGMYLTYRVTASFVHALSSAVLRWTSLENVHFWYKPTPLPPPVGQPQHDPLAVALASAPLLKVVRACRPTLLNSFLLDVAENPALERIELLDDSDLPELNPTMQLPRENQKQGATLCSCPGSMMVQMAVAEFETSPRTMFASQLAAHPRLDALVRAGRMHLILQRLQELYRRSDFIISGPSKVCDVCLGVCARTLNK